MYPLSKKIFVALSFGLILFAVGCKDEGVKLNSSGDWSFSLPIGKEYDYSDILVTRVIDGDTIQLASGERVRLIGIDTPEMHDSPKLTRDAKRSQSDVETIKELGRKACAFTKELVEGKRVSLEFDVQRYDRYNRLLAYVYLKENKIFVNAEIIKQGYASLLTIPPDVKYADTFRLLYQEARENKRGLWSQ